MKKPLVLCILDGVGLRNEKNGNAFKNANTPTFDYLWENFPHCLLNASGKYVGLPHGQMGNSEVGHMNIGAGRVVYQPLEFINKSIEEKTFFENNKIIELMNHVKNNDSKLHIMGLISDGGVHSHISHLIALLDMCKKNNVKNVYLHLATDGRDVAPESAYSYILEVQNKLDEMDLGSIATVSGRYYIMDRDNNYDRLKKSYDLMMYGIGNKSNSIQKFIEDSYKQDITDEFLIPTLFDEKGIIEDNDGFITFNFRKDRLRELLTALTNPSFNEMEIKKINNLKVLSMLPVTESVIAPSAFENIKTENILGEILEKNGLSQLRIAETEKYAHVTFFFDGGKEVNYSNENKILIPSPKVATYDLKPEMSAKEVTEALINELEKDYYDVIILNYANGDMVGHTGNYDAAVKAVEYLDECLKLIYDKITEKKGVLIVTADHGNCDIMFDEEKNIVTSHTTSLVPFIITNSKYKMNEGKIGKLADIAPTILEIMDIDIPSEMTGEVLIIKK